MAEQSGFILVSAVTATGSYPLEGAEVMISELTDKGDTVIYRYITDESGQTPLSELGAPDVENSLSPDSGKRGFSLYNVTVRSDGFYPLSSLDVPVFPGIVSRQQMILSPYTQSGVNGTDEFTPDCKPYPGGCGDISKEGGNE
ncbi:MAG: hypothetical protein IKQ18_01230 [Clostridia bacterium]|nr:hypothetical protein [Clostridia bacterium]